MAAALALDRFIESAMPRQDQRAVAVGIAPRVVSPAHAGRIEPAAPRVRPHVVVGSDQLVQHAECGFGVRTDQAGCQGREQAYALLRGERCDVLGSQREQL